MLYIPSPQTQRRSVLRLAAWVAAVAAAPSVRAVDSINDPATEARERKGRAWFTDTILLDQDGRRQRFYSDLLAPAGQARVVLVHPLFTGCSSACPLIVKLLLQVRSALDETRQRDLAILSLSVDPLADDPPALKAFAVRHGADLPRWHFLGGSRADVERVARRLGLWTDVPDAHATVLIAGRAAAGHWRKLRPDQEPRVIAQQLDRFW